MRGRVAVPARFTYATAHHHTTQFAPPKNPPKNQRSNRHTKIAQE